MAEGQIAVDMILKAGAFKGEVKKVIDQLNKMEESEERAAQAAKFLEKNSLAAEEAIKKVRKQAEKAAAAARPSFAKMAQSSLLLSSKILGALGTLKNFAAGIDEMATRVIQTDAMMVNFSYNMEGLQKATGGLVTNFEILKASSMAVEYRLGLSSDQMETLSKSAAMAALRMGGDVNKAMNDIIVGMSRMSPKILDNLGIIVKVGEAYQDYSEDIGVAVNQLSDHEKRLAFNNAVVKSMTRNIKNMGDVMDTSAISVKRSSVALQNFWDKTKSVLVVIADHAIKAGKYINILGPLIAAAETAWDSLEDKSSVFLDTMDKINFEMAVMGKATLSNISYWDKFVLKIRQAQHHTEHLSRATAMITRGAISAMQKGQLGRHHQQFLLFSDPVRWQKEFVKSVKSLHSDAHIMLDPFGMLRKKHGRGRGRQRKGEMFGPSFKDLMRLKDDDENRRAANLAASQAERDKNFDLMARLDFERSERARRSREGRAIEARNVAVGAGNRSLRRGDMGENKLFTGLEELFKDLPGGLRILDDIKVEIGEISKAWNNMGQVAIDAFGIVANTGVGAMQAFTDALWEAWTAQKSLSGQLSQAFHLFLKEFGKEMQLLAIKELALGLGTMITNPPESASHFASFAMFQAAALAAGFGARATAPKDKAKKNRGKSRGRGGTASISHGQVAPTTMTFNINSLVSSADEEAFARAIGSGMRTARARGYA